MPVNIFFCYAREDEALRKELEKQLRVLKRQGLVDVWHDRNISAGEEWEREIDKHLNTADIILLLVSPDFIDSDYCYSIEMKRAMERYERGEARVLPIILRPVYWYRTPFGKLQALPTDARPITGSSWHNLDEAYFDVAEGIRRVIGELTTQFAANDMLQEKGGNKYDKFTEHARHVLTLAKGEAIRFEHQHIGTEHILLGLASDREAVGAKVLVNLGLKLSEIRSAVELAIVGENCSIFGLTPNAKKAIEFAVDEARRFHHQYVGSEHLLLGLIREGNGMGAGILIRFGVNLQKARTQTEKVLAQQ